MWIIWSLILVVIVAICGLWLARYINLLDRPGRDVAARKSVPTLQGIFLYIAIVLAVRLFSPEFIAHPSVWPLLIWSWLLMLISAVDEGLSLRVTYKKNLKHLVDVIPARMRLVLQLAIIIAVVVVAWLYHREFNFLDVVYNVPSWLWVLFALWWFMLFTNSINRFDYAYGQASGLSFLGFVTIIILVALIVLPHYTGISPENYEVLQIVIRLASVFAMVSFVYTIVEYKPYGLLRDAGVMVYGFALAYLSLLWGAKIGTIMVALSLPIFDAIRVICHRVFVLRKNPMKWDYTHLHHRLLALGWSRVELRRFIWLWSVVMMILILLQWINRVNKAAIFVLFALIYFGVNAYIFRYKKKPTTLIKWDKG